MVNYTYYSLIVYCLNNSIFIGLQSALLLQKKLPSKECTAVVNCLAADSLLDWNSEHIKYLVMKTAVPGSGIAIILSCDLSAF